MPAEKERGGSHLRPGVSGRDKGIRFVIDLKLDPNRHGIVRPAAQRCSGFIRHGDRVGRFDDRDPLAQVSMTGQLAFEQCCELILDHPRLSYELYDVLGIELGESM